MAQSSKVPTEFPKDAVAVAPEAIKDRLSGKVFKMKISTGDDWRLEFKSNGYFFFNAGRGYSDSGKWRVDGSKWCADLQKTGDACSELWERGEDLFYKRASNGEVIQMVAR